MISKLLLTALFTWTLPSAEQLAEGWIALFDGQDTYGWVLDVPENWSVEPEAALVGKAGAKLQSTTTFGKSLLSYEFQKEGDSEWTQKTVPIDGVAVLEADEEKTTRFRKVLLKPLGMKKLFNGKDLEGWKAYTDAEFPGFQARFEVEPETKRLHVVNGPGMLESAGSYGDFVLQLEVMTAAENLNSGVFFRCIPGEKMNGYESQIQNGFLEGDRTKPMDAGTGAIFRRTTARYIPANDKEWCFMTIVAVGPHFSVWVNGLQVTDWMDERKPNANPRRGLRLEPGTLMLQAHDGTTDVYFRNIQLSEIQK